MGVGLFLNILLIFSKYCNAPQSTKNYSKDSPSALRKMFKANPSFRYF